MNKKIGRLVALGATIIALTACDTLMGDKINEKINEKFDSLMGKSGAASFLNCPAISLADSLKTYTVDGGKGRHSIDKFDSKCTGKTPGSKIDLTIYTLYTYTGNQSMFRARTDSINLNTFTMKKDDPSSATASPIQINITKPTDKNQHKIQYILPDDFDASTSKVLIGFDPGVVTGR